MRSEIIVKKASDILVRPANEINFDVSGTGYMSFKYYFTVLATNLMEVSKWFICF